MTSVIPCGWRWARMAPALALLGLFASCGGGNDAPEAGPAGRNAGADPGRPGRDADAKVLRFRKLEVFDPAAGVNAFSLLVPSDWNAEGGIVWRPHLSNQAAASMRIRSPDGSEVLEIMPCDPFTWRQGGIPFFGPGQIYLGNEVGAPVSDPADYVLRFAIPRYRPEIRSPAVVSRAPLPELAAAVAQARAEAGVKKDVRAERVRVAYSAGGTDMHEDFFCVLIVARPVPVPGVAFWGPDSLCSFRAPAGRIEACEGMLKTMLLSVRITPQWFNIVAQVQQMWVNNQMRAIRAAGQVSDYISKTSREISDMMMQAYENRQASQDRINDNFSRYIRGVEAYGDPFKGRPVELPSGYGNAWVSGNGEYVLTDNPNFNPNVGDNVQWRRMDQAP